MVSAPATIPATSEPKIFNPGFAPTFGDDRTTHGERVAAVQRNRHGASSRRRACPRSSTVENGPIRGRRTGLDVFGEVLAAHPRLPVVLAHAGMPDFAGALDSSTATSASTSTRRWSACR